MFFRSLGIVGACVLLAGCGLARMQERQEQMKVAVAEKDRGIAACKQQYPDGEKDFVLKQMLFCCGSGHKTIRNLSRSIRSVVGKGRPIGRAAAGPQNYTR